MVKKAPESLNLKDACLLAAREIIAERGVENLSLREVSRKLGVSHQAPYKHYPSRDHLLAEVMRQCFISFTAFLNRRKRNVSAANELESLGKHYLKFAMQHPLEYRLMFGTPWPEPANHPDLVENAVHAFNVLRDVLSRLHTQNAQQKEKVDAHAMFIWSTMHGLASIMQSDVARHLEISPNIARHLPEAVMQMMDSALHQPSRLKE